MHCILIAVEPISSNSSAKKRRYFKHKLTVTRKLKAAAGECALLLWTNNFWTRLENTGLPRVEWGSFHVTVG
jgi:hypothetical protein